MLERMKSMNQNVSLNGGSKWNFPNIYGVVLGFTPPSHARSGEWMSNIILIDETHHDVPECVVSMNMFSLDIARLPKVMRAGDVLRAHRVRLQVCVLSYLHGLDCCTGCC